MPHSVTSHFPPTADIFVIISKAMVDILVHVDLLLLLDDSRVKFLSGESVSLRHGPLGVGWGGTLD